MQPLSFVAIQTRLEPDLSFLEEYHPPLVHRDAEDQQLVNEIGTREIQMMLICLVKITDLFYT